MQSNRRILVLCIATIVILLLIITMANLIISNHPLDIGTGRKINFLTHSKGWDGMYALEEYLLFTDSEGWKSFLNRSYQFHHEWSGIDNESLINNLVESRARYLNFSNRIYLGAFWGVISTGGYSIEIKELALNGNVLNVFIENTKPGPDQAVPDVISFPHHIISIDKKDVTAKSWFYYREFINHTQQLHLTTTIPTWEVYFHFGYKIYYQIL